MHSDRASAKVPQRAPRIKKSTVHFRRQRLPRGRFRPCRWRKPGGPLGRPAAGRLWEARTWTPYVATADVLRMYEKNEGRHLPSALHKSAARHTTGRRLRPPPACATASRPSAPPCSPALSRARPGRRRLRRPDPARARRRPPTGAGHAARLGPAGGRARHPGPHPGGQLGGPARGDAGLRATARRRAAARRRSVGGGARAARPAPLAGSAGAVPRRHARLSVPARLRRRHRHDAGGRRPARRGAGRGRAAGPRPPRDADAHLALAYVHARRNTPFEALHATDARATWRPAPPTWNASMCSPCNALAWPARVGTRHAPARAVHGSADAPAAGRRAGRAGAPGLDADAQRGRQVRDRRSRPGTTTR